ncbi:hypothetical protein [Rheinheimera sp. MMS21-TC3]|uniref:hypothetical protein n=1 Tax=Rheinheimera sp. MMS21-TC3 TaxID=3072790 RepID=UPI0028C43F3E|nr:hypothetical protein [Rheinheimera sp. MMS21-TC3]WNO61038.1 hypothetical protein RDV63_08765 [Rheinheimera sp. MMS21-TC3]
MAYLFIYFKNAYSNNLRVKALVFATAVSAIVLSMFGWSLFENSDFYVFHDEYEFVSETGGGRVSPTFLLANSKGIIHEVKGGYFDCFYRFDLEKVFYIGFVNLGGDKVVVACAQGDVKLNISDGLLAVNKALLRARYIACASLIVFVFSVFILFCYFYRRKIL